MKKTTKIILIVGLIAVAVGLILAGAAAGIMFSSGIFDNTSEFYNQMSTVEYVRNTYTTTESFENIDIDCAESDIMLVLSDEFTTSRVECSETDKITHRVEVRDNTLFITIEDERTWKDYISFMDIGTISATVYLPKSAFEKLSVDTASGDIDIPNTFTFSEAELDAASGDISFFAQIGHDAVDGVQLTAETASGRIIIETRTIMEKLYVSTASGDISISNTAADDVNISTASGRIEAYNLSAGRYNESTSFIGGKFRASSSSGDIKLSVCEFGECSVETASGDVKLDGVDADNYDINTASGDVKGTIRSYKNFITSTSSGDVNVPSSNPDNGECRISTASGDIDIRVVF